MANATNVLILDRVIAICNTVAGLKTARYWPRSLDSGRLPLATAYLQPGQRTRPTEDSRQIRRTVIVAVILDDFNMGIPSETALKNAEAIIEPFEDAFEPRDRLQLDGDILAGLVYAELGDDTGIYDYEGKARIDFPLYVTYERDVTPL